MRHSETGRNKLLLFLNELCWFYPAGVILAMTILSLFKIDLFRVSVSIGIINFLYKSDTMAMDNRNVKRVMRYSQYKRVYQYFYEAVTKNMNFPTSLQS